MSSSRPRILVTNDDGVRARGLAVLAAELQDNLGDVTVVAPDREQSGASHAMTLRQPLRIAEIEKGWWSVEGTPTDCVNVAFFHILDTKPDLVVSGINAGYNMGEDVTYSGTVAGALEGRILGAPAVAVSADSQADEQTVTDAARWARRFAALAFEKGLPADALLNINVPPRAVGWRFTEQGKRAYREGLVSRIDPKGHEYYWIGLAPARWEPNPEADSAAIEGSLVSVTPLHSDMTCHRAFGELSAWSELVGDAP
jgi:5'-nucleotidase